MLITPERTWSADVLNRRTPVVVIAPAWFPPLRVPAPPISRVPALVLSRVPVKVLAPVRVRVDVAPTSFV